MKPHYNQQCQDCRFRHTIADTLSDEHIHNCTNAVIIGWAKAQFFPIPIKAVAVKLDRPCKQYKRKRKSPTPQPASRANRKELFA